MSCLSLTLICIVLQSNIALIFGAPIEDCKSKTHTIDDKEIKVTSHVNVALPDKPNNSIDGRNPVKNHGIEFGDDSSMHIKIDISITPEMLADSAESAKPDPTSENDSKGEARQRTLAESTTALDGTQNVLSEKRDQLAPSNTSEKEGQTKEDSAAKENLEDATEEEDEEEEEEEGNEGEEENMEAKLSKQADTLISEISAKNLDGKTNNDLETEPKSVQAKAEAGGDETLEEEEEEEDGQETEAEETKEAAESEAKNEASVEATSKGNAKNSKAAEEEGHDEQNDEDGEAGEEEEEGDYDELGDEDEGGQSAE